MNKKVLSLVLALAIVLGSIGLIGQAKEEAKVERLSTQDQKIQWLVDNEIVIGKNVNEDGSADLALEDYVTRAEITKLLVYTLKLQNLADALKGAMKPFPDVDINHWANGYVSVATTTRDDVAKGRRIVIGYPDGNFHPENNVTYAELSTMLVRIVKEDLTDKMEAEANANWAVQWMRWAEELGILEGLTIADSDKPVPRKDAFEMIYNAMYKLGTVNKNAPKFGDVMGVVSKVQAGKIQLNQDSNMEYTITFNSRVTNGTTWRDVANNAVNPGALVRLIANKDGEVEYLIELGNPVNGAVGSENTRWFDVADKTAETRDFDGHANAVGTAYFKDTYFSTIVIGDVVADIDSDTRFFVADVTKNALKEVGSLNEVFKLYVRDFKEIPKVYMGYDEYLDGKVNEAKVIVFGSVDKYTGGTDVRRVTGYYSTKYHIEAEDTKGTKETFNLSETNYFPAAKFVDKMDVIKLYLDGDKYTQSDFGKVGTTHGYELLIDYSKDPVFEVLSVGDREIKLRDEFGRERSYVMPKGTKVFLEGEAKKGAHVQIAFNKDNRMVDVVSVVDKDLKGVLPDGARVGAYRGFLQGFRQIDPNTYAITVAKWDKDAGFYGHNTYHLHLASVADLKILNDQQAAYNDILARYDANGNLRLDTAEYKKYLADVKKEDRAYKEIVFDVQQHHGDTDYAYNIDYYNGTGVLYDGKDPIPTDTKFPANVDARIRNTGNCPIYVATVNGHKVVNAEGNAAPIKVEKGAEITAYNVLVDGKVKAYKFQSNDKVIVQSNCGDEDCKLDRFEVKRACGGTDSEVKVGNLKKTAINACGEEVVCQGYKCAAEIVLGCFNEIEAVGRTNKKTEKKELNYEITKSGEIVISNPELNKYLTVEDVTYVGGKVYGTVKATKAGEAANVKVTKVVIEGGLPARVESKSDNFIVDLSKCTTGCKGTLAITVYYTRDCEVCPESGTTPVPDEEDPTPVDPADPVDPKDPADPADPVEPGSKSKEELANAINEAIKAMEGVVTAEKAEDVAKGAKFVTPAEKKALEDAIEAAKKVNDDPKATQEEIDNATKAIKDATKKFIDAIKIGTKTSGLDKDNWDPKAGPKIALGYKDYSHLAETAKATILPGTYPEDAIIQWSEYPAVNQLAQDVPGKVKVLYKDGSFDIVDVKVDVETISNVMAERNDPKAIAATDAMPVIKWDENIQVLPGEANKGFYPIPAEYLDPKSYNKDDVASIEWKPNAQADTRNTGIVDGIVRVNYKDGSSDDVSVQVRVVDNGAEAIKGIKNASPLYTIPHDINGAKSEFYPGVANLNDELIKLFDSKYHRFIEKVAFRNLPNEVDNAAKLDPGTVVKEFKAPVIIKFVDKTYLPRHDAPGAPASSDTPVVANFLVSPTIANSVDESKYVNKPVYRWSPYDYIADKDFLGNLSTASSDYFPADASGMNGIIYESPIKKAASSIPGLSTTSSSITLEKVPSTGISHGTHTLLTDGVVKMAYTDGTADLVPIEVIAIAKLSDFVKYEAKPLSGVVVEYPQYAKPDQSGKAANKAIDVMAILNKLDETGFGVFESQYYPNPLSDDAETARVGRLARDPQNNDYLLSEDPNLKAIKLPVTFGWHVKPDADNANIGDTIPGTVKITYPDGSFNLVDVQVKVVQAN